MENAVRPVAPTQKPVEIAVFRLKILVIKIQGVLVTDSYTATGSHKESAFPSNYEA